MIDQNPSRSHPGMSIPITYSTDPDYIDCLGVCDRQYTSDSINREDSGVKDLSIPTMLRATAVSPYKRILDAAYKEIYKGGNTETLNHAKAVIPASNGAFWTVYPFHYDSLNFDEEAARERYVWFSRIAVRYYPAGAKTVNDFYTGERAGNYYSETIRGEDSKKTLSEKKLRGGHPCGATYMNITLPVTISPDALKLIKTADTYKDMDDENVRTDLLAFFGQDGVYIKDESEACVDVLVCYGGYNWMMSTDGRIMWGQDGTIRYYVPSSRINVSTNGQTVEAVKDPNKIIWQTICRGGSESGNYKPDIWVGASLIKIEGNAFLATGGGVARERDGTFDLVNRDFSCYPWTEYTINVQIEAVAFDDNVKTLHLAVNHTKVFDYTQMGQKRLGFDSYCPCFNVISQEITKGLNFDAHHNYAPLMYPILYNIDGYMIAHGAEWIGTWSDKTNGPWDLSYFVKLYFETKQTGGKKLWHVCHIPLITSQYILRGLKSKTQQLPYPLNISGAVGMMEGALAVPSLDGKSLIITGGGVSKYSVHCYPIREELKTEYADKRFECVPPLDDCLCVLAPVYEPAVDQLLCWDSKIITPGKTITYGDPFTVERDSLKYDCLFSQCVRLGTSNYFVAPSSYFKYYDDGAARPNMTLIKSVKPLELTDISLANMDDIEALEALTTHLRVGEVVNLQVWMETPETYACETPCYYGRASTAKCSLGAVRDLRGDGSDENGNGFWLYKLGNGSKPAEYYHIVPLQSATCIYPINPNHPSDQWGASTYAPNETDTPGTPNKEWIS